MPSFSAKGSHGLTRGKTQGCVGCMGEGWRKAPLPESTELSGREVAQALVRDKRLLLVLGSSYGFSSIEGPPPGSPLVSSLWHKNFFQ